MPALFGACDYMEEDLGASSSLNRRLANMDEYCEDFLTMDDSLSQQFIFLEHCCSDNSTLMSTSNSAEFFSEDIWNKFELLRDVAASSSCDEDEILSSSSGSEDDAMQCHQKVLSCSVESANSAREIRHHDCMWAGRCSSEEHNNTDGDLLTPPMSPSPLNTDSQQPKLQKVQQPRPINSRSLLVQRNVVNNNNNAGCNINNISNNNNNSRSVVSKCTSLSGEFRTYESAKVAVNRIVRERMNNIPDRSRTLSVLDSEGDSPRPDTPISDFDEPSPFSHHTNIDCDDSDEFSDGKSEEDEEEEDDDEGEESEESNAAVRLIKQEGFFNDHSYHQQKSSIKTDNLGVQTPSDSEEEIDVVSLSENTSTATTATPVASVKGSSSSISRSAASSKQQGNKSSTAATSSPIAVRSARTNLPTNPSPRDCQQLQLTVAAIAANSKRNNNTTTMASSSSTVPPIRIRIDSNSNRCSKKRSGNSTDADVSSSDTAESAASTTSGRRGAKRGKYHRRSAYDRDSSSSSPRKRGSRSGSDSEDSSGKRNMHNTMERQRRVDLRNAFESLRVIVPKLCDNERAPKVNILKEAGLYCRSLSINENNLTRREVELRKKQTMLRDRLSQLRRSLAAAR